jgi:uncharacterized OB-fold protein
MSNSYNKPLPQPQRWSQEFWQGIKKKKLLLKKCKACGHIDFPPYLYCTECMSLESEWVESSGKGTVYSFSTTYLGAPPAFTADQPYTLIFVDLEEGIRMLSVIKECAPEDVKIGMKVEALFESVTDEVNLVYFNPVE